MSQNKQKKREVQKRYREKRKIRMQTDPQFAEEFKRQRHEQYNRRIARLNSDPAKKEIFIAKKREAYKRYYEQNRDKRIADEIKRQHKKKAEMPIEQIELASKRKLKILQNSLLTPEEKKAEERRCKKDWKRRINIEFIDAYGFSYYAYGNIKSKYKLSTISDVIEFRIKKRLSVKPELIEQYKSKNQPSEPIKQEPILIKQESEPIKQEPILIKQYDKNQQYIDRYGVSYNTLMHYKKLHGFNTIDEAFQWYKATFGIDPSKCSKTKESAWRTMQNKISILNCTISIESIRNAKINELQQNFYNQYGAM